MMQYDAIVIGAGPAGAAAALTCSELGLSTLLLDEQDAAGGQIWRAPSVGAAQAGGSDSAEGAALRRRLADSRVVCRFGRRVWLVEPAFIVHSTVDDALEQAAAPAVIVANGAIERHWPVAGWTLPGVFGLAAATVLLKSFRVLPGKRVVVAGAGPLLPLVAHLILKAGGSIAAVVDANPARAWIAKPAALLSRPDLLARGTWWRASMALRGVPWLFRHAIRRIEGTSDVAGVTVSAVDHDWAPAPAENERRIACDAVCMGFGLTPATEITRLLGAQHGYDAARGGWCPTLDQNQATTLPGLYACGDGAGVLGAAAAPARGELAALGVTRYLGRLTDAEFERRTARPRRRLARAAKFGRAMTMLTVPPAGAAAAIDRDAIVCRCELLSRATLDLAIAEGAVTLNELKATTRCGMGPCGGRICEEAAAHIIAARTGKRRADLQPATARPPLRPLPLAALGPELDYADLPLPEPAPL
jgi:thioredoxin reductase/bacterioferritin-associated ferredoxin